MAVLTFEKPKKVRTSEEHAVSHMSDCGVPGTYVPNMSQADNERWKAKHIKGDNERIEIRKSLDGVQLVIVVRKNPPPKKPRGWDHNEWKKYHEEQNNIKISMNGSLWLSFKDHDDMNQAITEAIDILNENN